MLPDLLVGTISGGGERRTAILVRPTARLLVEPVPEPAGPLKALARHDRQGNVLGESCSNMEALEVLEIKVKNSQGGSLGADAEANREVQDVGQSTQEGAAPCEEVHHPFREEASEENAQHTEVSLAGEDQRPKIAESGHGTGTGKGEIHSAATSKWPFEPEATTASIDPTCSSATRTIQAPAGGTLDAKAASHTAAGAESKCPFAAILKAAGHDITGMSMPANHKSAHVRSPTGSPLDASSGAAGLFKEKPPWRGGEVSKFRTSREGVMSELDSVPETRPMVVASDVELEDDIQLECADLSTLGGTTGWQAGFVGSEESQRPSGGSISRTNATGWLKAAGSSGEKLIGAEKHVFKFSLHEAASQSSRHSSITSKGSGSKGTGSKGTGSKHSGGGRAGARKRRQRVARAKGNKVDMDEWNRRVVTIKDFWNNLFKTVSMTRLGTSLLDTVETDDTLEPLFRCISALCVHLCVSCSIRLRPTTPSSPSSGVYLFSALQCVLLLLIRSSVC
jgi:hypothetical protein